MGLNLVLTLAWALSIPWMSGQMAVLPPVMRAGATILAALVVYIAACAIQITVLDGLLNAVASWSPLREFFLKSHTRSFGRYRAPGFKPDIP